jgi:hypothetical protein
LELPYVDVETLRRAVIAEILHSGEIVVRVDDASGRTVRCEVLETSAQASPPLQVGDRVLVLNPDDPSEKGCVLGRIGTYKRPNRKHVVLDADEELTIRCGKGSITIRKTGKILVKGFEIVSHAKGANRIRGGSIQLN